MMAHKISRIRMARHVGRTLLPTEFVHHINENQRDNRLENLQMVSPPQHRALHPRLRHRICRKCSHSFSYLEGTNNRCPLCASLGNPANGNIAWDTWVAMSKTPA